MKGCQYEGTFILEGEMKKVAPCKYCNCDNGETYCAIQDCARPPANCYYTEPTMEQCCNLVCEEIEEPVYGTPGFG